MTNKSRAHEEAHLINETKQLDPASNCEYALAHREPMTHEIVQRVKTLATRLARHSASKNQLVAARRADEYNVLATVVASIPPELFAALGEKCTRLVIAKHGDEEICLVRMGNDFVCPDLMKALETFTLPELLGGLVAALAQRIDDRQEAGRKLTRLNRRLRGILAILDS